MDSKIKRIILEGNECNYKTTIANKLKKKLDFEIVKGSSFEIATGTNEAMHKHFNNVLDMNNVIIDRFIYSNMVYASLYPKYTILTNEQFIKLDKELEKQDSETIILYLYTNVDTLKERMRERGDEYIKEDELESINSTYHYFWNNSTVAPYGIDTSLMSSDEIVDFVMNRMISHNT